MEEFLASGTHWRILNFALFIGLLLYFLKKPVGHFWTSRSHQLKFDMEEAHRLKQESKGRHDSLKARLSQIEKEIAQLVTSMKEEGELEKKRIVEEGEKVSQRMKSDAEKMAAQEIRRAKEALRAQSVNLSIELAERLIREKIMESDQKKLTDHYLNNLETLA